MRGVVSVETGTGTWIVTTLTAVAIPPWQVHRVSAHGNASLRSVFVDPDVLPDLIDTVATIQVSRLLHELIGEAGRRYTDFDDAEHSGDATASIIALIVELLPLMPSSSGTASSVWVPRLETELLRPIAIAIEDDPGDPTSVEEWARRLGLSVRHLHRVFKAETGVTLSTWKALHHVSTRTGHARGRVSR